MNIILVFYGARGGSPGLFLMFGLIYLVIYFFIIRPKNKVNQVTNENSPKEIEDISESPSIFEDETNKPKTFLDFVFKFHQFIFSNKRKLIITGLFILALITIRSFVTFTTGRTLYRSNPTVVAAADSIVGAVLKSYSNPKFLNDKHCTVKLTGKEIYTVSSYVESQNSFGDIFRNKFEITIQNTGAKWITLDFILDGKKLK